MHEDAELLRQYATDRSEAAFTELIRRQVDLVYSAALRLMNGDVHRAQDLTQQVFSELARQAKRLTRHPALAGWLYMTTRLMALRAKRTERRRTAREQEANAMNELLREPGPQQDWKHLGPVLEDAMHELGEKDRLAVLLRFFQNKSLKEVGLVLGLSENAARMRVERALDKLRAQLARKGVTSTAAALALMLAGNAVSATPAGFVATLTSASFASAAAGTGITLALLKFMAATKFKTGVISAIVVASVVTPLAVQHQAQARLRDQDEALRDRTDRLTRLQEENARLSDVFAQANKSPPRSNEQFSELLRLRGEVGRLRMDLRELEQVKTNAPMSRNEMLATMANYYSERVNQLMQLLETNPSERIPELQFLTDDEWLTLAGKVMPDTEDGHRRAMSMARFWAEQNFVNGLLDPALQRYAQDHAGQFPGTVSQLKPYFKSPVDDAVLQRWEVVPKDRLVSQLQALEAQLDEDWYITQKTPVDEALDQRILRGLKRMYWPGNGPPRISENRPLAAAMTEFQIIVIGVIALAGGTASLVIQHAAQVKGHENGAVLQQQDSELVELTAEHLRLSNLVAQANSSPAGDQAAEFSKLRAEAEALRKQTNELGKQLAEDRWSRQSHTRPRSRSDTHYFVGMVSVVSDSTSEEYANQLNRMTHRDGKMGDVLNLSSAVRKYASEHQGEYPTNFDQAAPYFYEFQAQANKFHEQLRKLADSSAPPKEVNLRDSVADKGESGAPPKQQESSRLSEFEMVYQGSYNELTNVPWQGVALIRERQAWPTPSGKWARIYVMANGEASVVEADDNFQSWEAEHILPPAAADQ